MPVKLEVDITDQQLAFLEYLARGVLTGILVRNEGREALDLNPIDGLDEPLAPANTFTGNPPKPGDEPPKKGDDNAT